MKILVAYYSRTGHTRRLAELLAGRIGATLCPITERRSRSGPFAYPRSVLEAVLGLEVAIDPVSVDLLQFDTVLFGTPVWCWHLSPAVRSFANRNWAATRRCAFFCTMGASGAEGTFADLERCLGRGPAATLALTERELASPLAESRIQAFITQLGARGVRVVRSEPCLATPCA